MPSNQTTSTDSPLRPLIDAIKQELLSELRYEIHAGIQSAQAIHPSPQAKRTLSLRELGQVYGVGRVQVKRDVREGIVRAVERRCRGGQIGLFVPIEEAERVYAAVRA